MKIQIASDLHLEFFRLVAPQETLVQLTDEADLLVLAGDIGFDTAVARLFHDWPCPVVAVSGNHELYGTEFHQSMTRQRQLAQGRLHFLDNSEARFGDVRVLGCTLWTDYRVDEPRIPQSLAMVNARMMLDDHRLIRLGDRLFEPDDALTLHTASVAWLEAKLNEPWDGKTLVVTHHAPSRASIHESFADSDVNGAFGSDLERLVERADAWVHGHMHNSSDYRVGRCRVVCNPAGYCYSVRESRRTGRIDLENASFDPVLVIDI